MALFLAMRNGDWLMRMAAIKSMAAVFCAFDRPVYQRLVPQHLADILCFPAQVMDQMKQGMISVRLTEGSNGHRVALDECHEMKINKDAKAAIVRPTPELAEKMSNFLQFRARCSSNLREHLNIDDTKQSKSFQLLNYSSRDEKADQNIHAMLELMRNLERF